MASAAYQIMLVEQKLRWVERKLAQKTEAGKFVQSGYNADLPKDSRVQDDVPTPRKRRMVGSTAKRLSPDDQLSTLAPPVRSSTRAGTERPPASPESETRVTLPKSYHVPIDFRKAGEEEPEYGASEATLENLRRHQQEGERHFAAGLGHQESRRPAKAAESYYKAHHHLRTAHQIGRALVRAGDSKLVPLMGDLALRADRAEIRMKRHVRKLAKKGSISPEVAAESDETGADISLAGKVRKGGKRKLLVGRLGEDEIFDAVRAHHSAGAEALRKAPSHAVEHGSEAGGHMYAKAAHHLSQAAELAKRTNGEGRVRMPKRAAELAGHARAARMLAIHHFRKAAQEARSERDQERLWALADRYDDKGAPDMAAESVDHTKIAKEHSGKAAAAKSAAMNTRGTSFEGNLERAHHYRKAAAHYDQAIHHYGQAGDVDRQEILQPLRDFSHEAARDHFLNASAQTDDREQTDQLDAFAKEHHAALGGKTSWHESDESVDEGAKEDLHKVYDTYARSFHGPKKNIKVRLAPIKPEVDPELKATDLSVRAQTVRNRGYSTRPNSVPQQHFDRLINLGGFGGPADVVKRLRAAKRELERRELAEPKRDPEGEEAAEDTAQDQVAKTAAGLKLLVKLAPVEKERSLSKTAAQEFRRQVNKQAKAEREKGVSTSLNPRLLPHFINRFPPRGDKGDPSGLEVAMNSTKRGHPNDPEGGDRRRDPEWMADYMRSWIRNREARQRRAG